MPGVFYQSSVRFQRLRRRPGDCAPAPSWPAAPPSAPLSSDTRSTQSLRVTHQSSIRQREMRLLGDYFDIKETLGEGGSPRCRLKQW